MQGGADGGSHAIMLTMCALKISTDGSFPNRFRHVDVVECDHINFYSVGGNCGGIESLRVNVKGLKYILPAGPVILA